MSQQFIEDLELPEPDYSFEVKACSQGIQTARIITFMENHLIKSTSRLVLVEGDTNTVLATALVGIKLGVPVGHVEAGLRSFDLRMPEEHNRRLADHISTYLFAPTKTAENNLRKENVWGEIYVTGNTVIDAVVQHMALAERKSKILESIRFDRFALATAHRSENVDNPTVLRGFITAFAEASIPIVYPIHPRTRKRLRECGLWQKTKNCKNIQVLSPLGYFDFLVLMKKSEIILTDSGGIQEEATAPSLRKRVLVLRLSTERPEAVDAGFARVIGVNKSKILKEIENALSNEKKELPTKSPYGSGNAGEKIMKVIEQGPFGK
jgi:UDP-N-acetylglucosamine 2-epimerase (non-hydrolysing)